MPTTAANYDAHYALLGLPPGANRDEILKARKRLAVRYHPDKIQEERLKRKNEELIKQIFGACDDLVAYWEEFNSAPPSDILDQNRKAEEERVRREEAERQRQQAAERERIRRNANLPILVPPIRKTLADDLADWLEAHHKSEVFYAGILFAVLIESVLLVRGFVFVLAPAGFTWNSSCGWTTFALITLQCWLIGHGYDAFRELRRLDAQRSEMTLSVNPGEAAERLYRILGRHGHGGSAWIHKPPHEDKADATTLLQSTLTFTLKCFQVLEIRYNLIFSVKMKATDQPTPIKIAYWFEKEASLPWWPPARAVIAALTHDLNASLGLPSVF